MKHLTQKQENFAQNLFQGMSQRQAYIKAGYSSNQLPATLDRHAKDLADNDKILTRLEELNNVTLTPLVMSVQERKEKLSKIARAEITDFVDDEGNVDLTGDNNAALAEITITEWQVGKDKRAESRSKKIKLINPISAIHELNDMENIGKKPEQYNDNRQVNFYITNQETEALVKKVTSGVPRMKLLEESVTEED